MNFLLLDLFKDFHFNTLHPESEQTGSLLLTNQYTTLREKCPNTEFFLVRSFPEFGPEKTPYSDTFYAVLMRIFAKLSSHSEVFLGKGVLKICTKFTGEQPCRSVISIKLLCSFIEITFWHGWSHVNLLHIFRTAFLKNTSGQPLLRLLKYLH